jgi:HipA-like C-terminal domain
MQTKPFDKEKIKSEIISYLRLNGKSSVHMLRKSFPYSQAFLSRLLSSLDNEIIVLGKARETEYAASRKIDGTDSLFPIYEVQEDGTSKQFGILHAIEPKGFYFSANAKNTHSSFTIDLPYFLNDMRPSGFLGHLIPNQNADLNLPKDIRMWSAEHCLKYLSCRSWDNIGNFIIGEKSFQNYILNFNGEINKKGIDKKNRAKKYSLLANDALSLGAPGSSAGGEQPKFLTTLFPENKPVIVKFSPPTDTEIGERVADLLICEHIALQVLKKYSHDTTDSEIIVHENRVFLEMKRFDRLNKFGRRGLVSLGTLDAEFSGVMGTWTETAKLLVKKKILSVNYLEEIRWRELFGEFIANNDMHLFNLSFFTSGLHVTKLAPTYDMLPMLFKPINNQLVSRKFTPPLPLPSDAKIWEEVYQAATLFWNEVLNDNRISKPFKKIAKDCLHKIKEQQGIAHLLPKN